MKISLGDLRRLIKEELEIDDFCGALDFVERWYDDHRKVSDAELGKWAEKYPYSGVGYRAVYPGESPEGGKSYSRSMEKFRDFLVDVDPEFNGSEVYEAKLSGVNLGKLCDDIVSLRSRNEKVMRISMAGEVIAIGKPENRLIGYVHPGGEIKNNPPGEDD